MINGRKFEAFEKERLRQEKTDPAKNHQWMEELYQEARTLGIFPLRDPLWGLETDIKVARILRDLSKSS